MALSAIVTGCQHHRVVPASREIIAGPTRLRYRVLRRA